MLEREEKKKKNNEKNSKNQGRGKDSLHTLRGR